MAHSLVKNYEFTPGHPPNRFVVLRIVSFGECFDAAFVLCAPNCDLLVKTELKTEENETKEAVCRTI